MKNGSWLMNKMRLKWKVFIYLLGFCSILLVILWLFQTVFLNDMYKFIRTRELNQVIERVGREIENADLNNVLIRVQLENDILVMPSQEFSITVTNYEPVAIRGRRALPFDAITETREFTLQNGQTLSLTFYALIAPVNATVTTLRMQLYIVTGIMIILSVFLAIVISKRVSRPIEDISRSAQTLAKGDYDTRFLGKGFQEIVALSDTLNTAALELGRVERLRRELLANVSHDLRTPLSLIYGYAEMMNDFPGDITPEQTKIIMDETWRLTTLVNDVLDLSKMETEMERLDISCFSLTESIIKTTARVEELLRNEDYQIVFEGEDDVLVDADETKIDRAFYNLLINAVNYSGESRTIIVTQQVLAKYVRISITDRGEGISDEDLPYIWDRYYKSGRNHTRAVAGTGLGLSIVKRIIDLHDGSYGVISEMGKGSTFWFELQIAF